MTDLTRVEEADDMMHKMLYLILAIDLQNKPTHSVMAMALLQHDPSPAQIALHAINGDKSTLLIVASATRLCPFQSDRDGKMD